ncbi:cytochrome P450 CYP82D47-like [Neltuma alba]|uniref:cytochrome P450 CYP82D47-like n=1 Tax=Neltuma alba TaxID=207710 RepID=UPI0010A4006E|nr:cytochrome P450 CYP82D47-like [Prosopis alba]
MWVSKNQPQVGQRKKNQPHGHTYWLFFYRYLSFYIISCNTEIRKLVSLRDAHTQHQKPDYCRHGRVNQIKRTVRHPGIVALSLPSLSKSRSHRRNKTTGREPPPEAGGAWPVIGHLHLLGGPEPPHITLGKMADKYGPIFTMRLGVHPTLIVSSWEIAKECFTANDRVFASRPKFVAGQVMGYNYSMLGASPYGSYWRHVRKIATMEVLSNHRLEMLKHVRESEVKSAMKDTYDGWAQLNSSSGQNQEAVPLSCEMEKWFGDIILNVVFRMVVGKRFVETEGNERIRKTLRDLFDLSGAFVISDALPYLRWLDWGGQEKAMKKTANELEQFIQFWLDEHRRKRDSGSGQAKPKHSAFMDVLLSSTDESEMIDGIDSNTMIKATSLVLILAATDTTTATLTWALSLLLNNREVLKKAVDEVDGQVGGERLASESDLKNLPYLQAILKETLRLYPAAPLNLLHKSMEDCTVAGYHIPSGTHLLTNLSKIQRDPRVYEDPLEFRPDRFLSTHQDLDLRGQHFELIPFGAGRRMCPGVSFALLMMQLTLANLLHGFDIATPHNEAVDMREQVGLTNVKASPLHVRLAPRLSSRHLYG